MRTLSRMMPLSRFPWATVILLSGCVVGFVVELSLGRRLPEFLLRFGLVPVALLSYFRGVEGVTFANGVLPFFSSVFLHGGFIHVVGNVLYVWLVGDVVEDWLGRTRFVMLVLFGVAAELIVRMGVLVEVSGLPSVGTSGAVAALIGGYLVILVKIARADEAHAGTTALLGRVPLVLGVLAWFPLQHLNGHFAIAATCQTREPVSWFALFTSFTLGMFLLSLSGRRIAATPAEATAVPTEEAVSVAKL